MDRRGGFARGRRGSRLLRSEGTTTLSTEEWGESSATTESVHPRDMLTARTEELEKELKEMEERHLLLESETREARDRAEAEECEDVVGVARRNVEGVARDVLINQKERTKLARLLDAEEDAVNKEEEEEKRLLLAEVGRLTRNVILLQTRLLILEEKRFEKKKLYSTVSQAAEKLAGLDKHHSEALEDARREKQAKYEKLYEVLHDRMRLVSQCSGRVGCSQQMAALRERGLEILSTQARLRKVEGLMLHLHRQSGLMKEEVSATQRELRAVNTLADTVVERATEARKVVQSYVKIFDKEDATDSFNEMETKFKSLILELETQVFERNDQMHDLQAIILDQEHYQKTLEEKDKRRKETREKLIGMSRVAELVLKDNDSTQKQTNENLSGRSSFLAEMSTIMLEEAPYSETDESHPQSEIEADDRFQYTKGFLGLIPKKNSTR